MGQTSTAHTSQLEPAGLREIRALLDEAFEGDFSDEDWDHARGGMHVLVREDGALVAHGSVVQRRVRHGGRYLRTGYVEAVAVHADWRRCGLGGQVMAEIEGVIERAYELGVLSASEDGMAFYAARGWQLWRGQIAGLSPDGVVRLPEGEANTYVWKAGAALEPGAELAFDWRDGDVL